MMKRICIAFVALMAIGGDAFAVTKKPTSKTTTCSNVVSINSIRNVLYKSSNLHGGRGMSFLVQNKSEQTGYRYLEMRSTSCQLVGKFGLWATDYPFGSRYYQQTGGSGNRVSQILAKLGGKKSMLVQGKNNRWILIPDITQRQGTITKP